MRMIEVVACYAFVIVLTLLVPASAQVSDLTTIDVPGASFTLPRGINPRGDIVGQYSAGGTTPGFLLDKEGSRGHQPWVPGAIVHGHGCVGRLPSPCRDWKSAPTSSKGPSPASTG